MHITLKQVLLKVFKYLSIALLPSLAWIGFVYLLAMNENPGDATGDFILLIIVILPISLFVMATVMLIDLVIYYRKKKKTDSII